MDLIDRNRVVIAYTDPKGPESDFSKGVEFAMDIYDRQPTVEAIPIEFIKQLIEKFDCERGNAIKDTYAHILTVLIEFWEFEQEEENETETNRCQ